MTLEGRYRIAVRGIIIKENKLLLLERSKPARGQMGYWELPGGGLDFGESPEEALKRELMEETGLSISVRRPYCTWDYMRPGQVQIIGITFTSEYEAGQIKLSDEHLNYAWVTKEDFADYKVFPELKEELSDLDW